MSTTEVDPGGVSEHREGMLPIVESIDVAQTDGSMAHMSFYDNWVLRDGRIGVHFAGVVRYPDGSYA